MPRSVKWKIFSNFVALSEYMNFTKKTNGGQGFAGRSQIPDGLNFSFYEMLNSIGQYQLVL